MGRNCPNCDTTVHENTANVTDAYLAGQDLTATAVCEECGYEMTISETLTVQF